ncbi:MAG: glycosyltransferase family 1 protein, partial [Ruminococcus sp.]|nr:glycosyltransferase family 1 protein [Ruminococcus sp.]
VAMLANNLDINGISAVIMNYCTNIDLEKFKITIIVGGSVAEAHKKVCDEIGISIIKLPNRKKSSLSFFKALKNTFGREKFDVVHVHGNQSAIAVELFLAKLSGIKIRIAHSHNTTCMSMKLHKLMKPLFKRVYTHAFACGEKAGQWLFENRPFEVIPNGFITEKFKFNPEIREKIRNELNLKDELVLGHIGRFNDQKNQTYLLKVFEYVAEKDEKVVLILVGTGPYLEKITEQINSHPYKDRIILYGETTEPDKMYMAMDVFVFPSKYEGLPVTLLEAQISGLACVVSDVITKEAKICENYKALSINENPSVWADVVLKMPSTDRADFYENNLENIKNYDIRNNVKLLEGLYTEYC